MATWMRLSKTPDPYWVRTTDNRHEKPVPAWVAENMIVHPDFDPLVLIVSRGQEPK